MIDSEQLTKLGRTNSMTETIDLSESYEESPGVSETFALDQENTEKVEVKDAL